MVTPTSGQRYYRLLLLYNCVKEHSHTGENGAHIHISVTSAALKHWQYWAYLIGGKCFGETVNNIFSMNMFSCWGHFIKYFCFKTVFLYLVTCMHVYGGSILVPEETRRGTGCSECISSPLEVQQVLLTAEFISSADPTDKSLYHN